ncbi:MAG TPA: DNA internalization-related competence protein ComEC/Rec2 [Myxococcaceae bacterium]|nr:DNA internalization-related competence protein ComEC/Rec2 [Myxococcaceae bacterium]
MGGWCWKDLGLRPLVFPVLALGLGCALPALARPEPGALACLAAALATFAFGSRTRPGTHLALLTSAVLAGSALAARAQRSSPLPTGRPVLLEGRLASVDGDGRGGRGVLEVSRVDGEPGRARTRLWWSDPELHPWVGQRVQLRAELRADAGPESWGQYDAGAAARARGLSTSGRIVPGSLVPLSPPDPLRRWVAERREGFGRWTRERLGEADSAALVCALAAGLRSELGPEWEDRFARSGLAHVLSVSGLHVAALALVLAALLAGVLRAVPALVRRLDPRRPAALAALPLVWGYVVFTGNQPPAVRSALMLALVLAGRALQRHSDTLNALALAAGLLLVADPASVRDLSLQLSFTAVAALVLLAPRLQALVPLPPPDPRRPERWPRALERMREALLSVCTASAAVTLASIPLVATAFHRISLVGWAVNVVALPVASVLTLACAVTAGAFCLSPALAAAPLWVASLAARALLALVRAGAAVPFGVLPSPSFSWPAAAAFGLGLLGVALGVRRAGWVVALAMAAVLAGPRLERHPALELTALPVGHGDALLASSGGAHLLVDGGGVPDGIDPGARVVVPYLRERGIWRLDAVALSHPHPDHALGLLTVLREIPVDRIWLPAAVERGPLVDALLAAAGRARVEWLAAGEVRTLGEATVRVLSPPRDAGALRTVNDRSLVLRLSAAGRSVLLPGDAGAAAEEALPPLESTVVKVPHHGSRTSSSPRLVSTSQAWLALFSDGRGNRFGLPAPEVVERWQDSGAIVLRTDLDGAIRVSLASSDVRWETFRGRAGRLVARPLAGAGAGGAPSPR